MRPTETLPCGCIPRSSYDDASDCKYHGRVWDGCNRMDYDPRRKASVIHKHEEEVARESL